ncbi:MAG TPA: hypothetical protein VMB48_05690 [Steroidobacteraceae bacterium]|nr:hypothetical protein [Steroidobacteraceae bacterium]
MMAGLAAAALLACPAVLPVQAADSAAGQKTFQSVGCGMCHQMKSYAGKSEAELQTDLEGIVSGKIKHPKKLTLTGDDIANLAAYIASNEPK